MIEDGDASSLKSSVKIFKKRLKKAKKKKIFESTWYLEILQNF